MVNPRHDLRFKTHKAALLRFIRPREMRGLEIGAFDLPFILPNEGDVSFADYQSTAQLRQLARTTEGHSSDCVVPVTYLLGTNDWSAVPGDFDWVAAAHVIEHAPSMIDWLRHIGDRLQPGGILFLVIPDKRYTFDYFRPETSLGKILTDHWSGKHRPGPGDVFDAHYYTRALDVDALWDFDNPPRFGDSPPAPDVLAILQQAQDSYNDVHCTIFSQHSFSRIIQFLCTSSLIPFDVEEIGEVAEYGIDFHCVLRKSVSA